MKAMLLAAGEGTRFRPHTTKLPKPALPLLNVPLGFYSFDFLKAAGVNSIVVNTFHLPHKVKDIYQSQRLFPVQFTEEKGQILGSGGGLQKAKSYFTQEEDFFLLNADEVIATKNANLFKDLYIHHKNEAALSTLLVMEHPEVGKKFGGVWVDSNDQVIGFGKNRPTGAAHGYHFMGVQILNQEIFQFLPENAVSNILYDALTAALRSRKKIQVFKANCHWFETGNLTDYLKATAAILKNIANSDPDYELLKKFLQSMTPQSRLIQTPESIAWIHSQSEVVDSKIKGFAVVGKGAKIFSSTLEASVVAEAQIINSQNLNYQFLL